MAAGIGKDKDKKESKKDKIARVRGEDVDSGAADLVEMLANQVVKDEKKKLRPGIRHKKRGKNAQKKISELKINIFQLSLTFSLFHSTKNTWETGGLRFTRAIQSKSRIQITLENFMLVFYYH